VNPHVESEDELYPPDTRLEPAAIRQAPPLKEPDTTVPDTLIEEPDTQRPV